MAKLNLDKGGLQRFNHAASGYGVEVSGGKPQERLLALKENLDAPYIIIDCRSVNSVDEFVESALKEIGYSNSEISNLTGANLRRYRKESEGESLILRGFDSMPSDVQTHIAQRLKGICERRDFEQSVAFACEEGGSVVRAEPDLSMRVQSFELDGNVN